MMRMISLLMTQLGFIVMALITMTMWTPSVSAQGFSTPPAQPNVMVTLKSARATAVAGERFHVVIDQKIAQGWHTYWRNPGDSGEPTQVAWTLPAGMTASPIKWPTPTAIPFGPLVNYGFSDQVILPIEITVPNNAAIGTTLTLAGEVRWLECADICIPGNVNVQIDVKIGATSQDSPDAPLVATALAQLPGSFAGTTRLTDLGDGGLQLIMAGVDTPTDAYFFPYEVKMGAIIDPSQPQKLVRGKDGFGLTLVKSTSFPANVESAVGGVIVLGKNASAKAYVINAAYEPPAAGTAVAAIPPDAPGQATGQATGQTIGNIGLWVAIGMALVGGLILNLMPCVFPILSMKALSLVEASQGDLKAARAHGLSYGGGVILTFLGLAAALIGLQSAGMAVGWGFQLQSPAIVVILAILMVLIGFNLLGFFEIGTSLQNLGPDLGPTKGAGGSFLTGVLAVIVAAPCTAPFMGAALGFAATQPAFIALLVFGALGLGFAAPFVALTCSPGLLRAFPKPGPWMVHLRQALAFPMFATAIWLIWVASAQAGQAGVLAALTGIFGTALAIWIARTWPKAVGKAIAAVIGLASVTWATHFVLSTPLTAQNQSAQQDNAWSHARVAQLVGEGKTVFVNFTADWCVTCKVNEGGVFANPDVAAALSGEKAVYLVADWTSRDDTIAAALARHGRIGVPLYLVYKPGQPQPVILPQILTASIVLDGIQ